MIERRVLDHGLVRLVDSMGGDLSVVRAARVSHDAAWRAGEDQAGDAKLIRYLWKNGHTTPFEAVTVTFEVKAPIFVFRQWHRHRTQSYNELSARYRELPEEFYMPDPAVIGTQSTGHKQARSIADTPIGEADLAHLARREGDVALYRETAKAAFALYRHLLAEGWPRELARSILPVSTYSHMFTTMNLLNCFRFLTLRLDPHAQYEIREYMAKASSMNATGSKYSGLNLNVSSQRAWHRDMVAYVRRWVDEHRDGREDTWTPAQKSGVFR